MNTKIAEQTTIPGIDAYKVVYQFVGNNHMQRTNTLIFFCKNPEEARKLASQWLVDSNVQWHKILSVLKA